MNPSTYKKLSLITVPLFSLGLFSIAQASDIPPSNAKPFSEILKKVERQNKDKRQISEAEFDDGYWEIKVCDTSGCEKLYIDPNTAKTVRQKKKKADDIPEANAKPISELVASLEKLNAIISEVEFERGQWEIKLYVDPNKS